MMNDPYSSVVRRLFANPKHGGVVDGGVVVRRQASDVDIELSAAMQGEILKTVRFRAYGCPHVLAASEALCEAVEGHPRAVLASFGIHGLAQELGVPVEKTGRLLILEDALRALNFALDGRNV